VSLTNFFTRLRKTDVPIDAASVPVAAGQPSKGLPRFLAGLNSRELPVLLDLGSVVGSNVSFFGETLGCKIFVEDLAKDIDRHVREGNPADLPAFFGSRFPQADATFDGILCWDLFDYVERPALQALAAQLARLLRPDGVVLAFFNNTELKQGEPSVYMRHVVVDQRTIDHRPYPAARPRQRPVPNRDIQRFFQPLVITDQFLLKSNVREVVFRKVAAPA
jgi:SAM-dependent methyltransferase